jgi:ankyrin repeat protein
LACENGHLEVIICLLEHGADVNIEDNVSTATSGLASLKTLNSGLVVMVEMVGGGGSGV